MKLAENVDLTYLNACTKLFEEQVKPNYLLRASHVLKNTPFKAAVQEVMKYLDNNMQVVFANQCAGVMTIDVLDMLNNLYAKPIYKQYLEGQTNYIKSTLKYGPGYYNYTMFGIVARLQNGDKKKR